MIEVLKQALDALENPNSGLVPHNGEWRSRQSIAITAIKEALAQTEQEPVDYEKLAALGWQAIECGICGGGAMGYPQRTEQEPCAKHCEATAFKIVIKNLQGEIERMKTPQRTWVGLTEEEVDEVHGSPMSLEHSGLLGFVRATEAKLKEKNNV